MGSTCDKVSHDFIAFGDLFRDAVVQVRHGRLEVSDLLFLILDGHRVTTEGGGVPDIGGCKDLVSDVNVTLPPEFIEPALDNSFALLGCHGGLLYPTRTT